MTHASALGFGTGSFEKAHFTNRGKRGGARTIVAFRIDHRSIFIYGFAKNEKDNISKSDEVQLKQYAKVLLGFTDQQIKNAIKIGELIEVV